MRQLFPFTGTLLALAGGCREGPSVSEQSDQEKTEPASPRRLEKSREDGQVRALGRAHHVRNPDFGWRRPVVHERASCRTACHPNEGRYAGVAGNGFRFRPAGGAPVRSDVRYPDCIQPLSDPDVYGRTGRAVAGFRLAFHLEVRDAGLQPHQSANRHRPYFLAEQPGRIGKGAPQGDAYRRGGHMDDVAQQGSGAIPHLHAVTRRAPADMASWSSQVSWPSREPWR